MSQVKSLKTGIKFKDTPVGKIPVDWESTTIENVCDILDGKRVPLNKEQRDKMKGDIPYYGANGIVDYINDYIFDEDLILLAEDGGYFEEYQTRPIAYLIHGKSWVNNHAHVLKVMGQANTNWVYYSLVHKNIVPFIKGGTRSKLNQAELRQIPIPLPPLHEQKNIAEILTTVDDAIEETDKIIEKTKELKKGLMQELLTRGIGHKKFKKTEIGKMPEEWNVVKLKDLYKAPIRDFGSFSTTKLVKYVESGIPFIRSENFKDGRFISEYLMYITDNVHKMLTKSVITKGILMFTKIGNIGHADIYNGSLGECNSNATIAKIDIDEENALSVYIRWVLNSKIASNQYETKIISTPPRINLGEISNLKIPLPKKNEQRKIIAILDDLEVMLLEEENKRIQLETLKKSLMQVLLTGRVRVKLH